MPRSLVPTHPTCPPPACLQVPPGQLVDTENLTTLLVVVPKAAKQDWVTQYEGLAEFVVPRSSEVRELQGRAERGGAATSRAGAGGSERHATDARRATRVRPLLARHSLPPGSPYLPCSCPHLLPLPALLPLSVPQVVAEDSDYVVCTVVLFRRVVDSFKTAARGKGFQVGGNHASSWGRAGVPAVGR